MKGFNCILKDQIKVLKINLNLLEIFKNRNSSFSKNVHIQKKKLIQKLKKYLFLLISKYKLQNKKEINC